MVEEQNEVAAEAEESGSKHALDVMLSHGAIQSMVYVVRGQQVMLDSDLASLYRVETRALNQAVKRNIARFPEKFCFQISEDEYEDLKSQTVISSPGREDNYGGRRTLPYVFNEQGIAMLSAVLRSKTAIEVSIRIMETFVEMRRYMAGSVQMFERMNDLEWKQMEFHKKTEARFEQIFDYIAEHGEDMQKIFFDGQIYDAFSLLVRLVRSAEKSIILIDNYVDVDTLNLLAKKNQGVSVHIYTLKRTKLTEADVEKFNRQYPELSVSHTEVFHDRFLIIDDERAYHIGASLKDAGKKCFAINQLMDRGVISDILQRLVLEAGME